MKLGIDLGGTKIEIIALVDNNSGDYDEIYRHRVATPTDYQQALQAINTLVNDAELATKQTGTLGIGIPGTVSDHNGLVKNANTRWLNGQAFEQDLAQLLNRQVRISNDANCMVVSEAIDGAGKGHQVVLGVILGTGAGSGICINGKPLAGKNGIGGEWGHSQLPWSTAEEILIAQSFEPCHCRFKGCIEQFVSGTGLCNDYYRRTANRLNGKEIVALADQGDQQAIATLVDFEDRLARALALYVNILDPDVIIIAGGVCNIERIYHNLPKIMPQYVLGGEFGTPIKKAIHGDSSGVRGSAFLW